MSYSLRNRNEIKTSLSFEDPHIRDTPRKEPDASHEVYSRSARRSKNKYRGPVVQFNPNLPPAAFPTLDTPRQEQPTENHVIDLETLPDSDSDSDSEVAHSDYDEAGTTAGSQVGSSEPDLHASPFSSRDTQQGFRRLRTFAGFASEDCHPSSITEQNTITMNPPRNKGALRVRFQLQPELQSGHDGTPDSHLAGDMGRMHEITDVQPEAEITLEISSSEEEEENDTQRQERGEVPIWADLSAALQVQLFSLVAEAHPNQCPIQLLRLNDSDVQGLLALVLKHDRQLEREQTGGEKHRSEIHKRLLCNEKISQESFRQSLERNIYRNLDDDIFNQSTASRVEQANKYLTHCCLNRKLLDDAWATIAAANAAALTRKRNASDPSASDDKDEAAPVVAMYADPFTAFAMELERLLAAANDVGLAITKQELVQCLVHSDIEMTKRLLADASDTDQAIPRATKPKNGSTATLTQKKQKLPLHTSASGDGAEYGALDSNRNGPYIAETAKLMKQFAAAISISPALTTNQFVDLLWQTDAELTSFQRDLLNASRDTAASPSIDPSHCDPRRERSPELLSATQHGPQPPQTPDLSSASTRDYLSDDENHPHVSLSINRRQIKSCPAPSKPSRARIRQSAGESIATGTPTPDSPPSVKRRAKPIVETSFLKRERPSTVRQIKLTEKALEQEADAPVITKGRKAEKAYRVKKAAARPRNGIGRLVRDPPTPPSDTMAMISNEAPTHDQTQGLPHGGGTETPVHSLPSLSADSVLSDISIVSTPDEMSTFSD